MGQFKPSEKEKEIISEANIQGNIENIIHFPTSERKNYIIIINEVTNLYAIRLINYEVEDEKVKIIAVKRFPDLLGFYQTKEEANSKVEEIKTRQDVSQCKYEIETQEDDIENILIIGRTGSGKSTLANAISNTDVFAEVVDTVGVRDTKLSTEKVLLKLVEAIHSIKGGKTEEIEAFEILTAFFGEKVLQYTTILRSKFYDFSDSEKCEIDREDLKKSLEENIKVFDIVSSIKEYLDTCNGNYKMERWDVTCVRINDFINAKIKLGEFKDGGLLDKFLVKKELGDLKREIIEEIKLHLEKQQCNEIEFEVKIEIPCITKVEVAAKLNNCCLIS
ncbi:14873_t:CDS:2 [Gigaspora margarita]|uniref:14873_t:CDS:1 n=1 Tax=Gigaspora margarita TaxID=4874 RepID=A0ABN7WKK9_GIGMA|nr:14873_t:CDS:2 [Gigaspora margarita]